MNAHAIANILERCSIRKCLHLGGAAGATVDVSVFDTFEMFSCCSKMLLCTLHMYERVAVWQCAYVRALYSFYVHDCANARSVLDAYRYINSLEFPFYSFVARARIHVHCLCACRCLLCSMFFHPSLSRACTPLLLSISRCLFLTLSSLPMLVCVRALVNTRRTLFVVLHIQYSHTQTHTCTHCMRSFIQLGKLNVTAHSIWYHLLLYVSWCAVCVPFSPNAKRHIEVHPGPDECMLVFARAFSCVCVDGAFSSIPFARICCNTITMAHLQCLHHSSFVCLFRSFSFGNTVVTSVFRAFLYEYTI